MATYTDTHNIIRETLAVGYRQDDRVSTLKVRFQNPENEYWGTFKGAVEINNSMLSNSTIDSSVISASTIINSQIPDYDNKISAAVFDVRNIISSSLSSLDKDTSLLSDVINALTSLRELIK